MQKIDTRIKNTSSQKGNMPTNVYAARATHHTRILDQHRRQTDVENTAVRHKNGKCAKVERAKLVSRRTETRRTGTASKCNAPNWHASN